MSTRSTLPTNHTNAGLSVVEALIAAALVALVFGGLFASVQAMISLINNSKAKAGAIALATERLEFIRSLSYDDVGTVSGVPSGAIPQDRTVEINGIEYHERVLVEFVDDPADGLAGADGNGIVADFKRVKIELAWQTRRGTSSVALVSNIVPPGVETTAGGGTIRVYVNDASILPVAGAAVRFVNTSGTTTIDTTRFTDPSGMAQLGGAPALGDYEIFVSRAGYSTDGTARAIVPLSSPAQPVVSVAEASVSTQYFQIDRLSSLAINTFTEPVFDSFFDTFDTSASIAVASNTVQSAGDVMLFDTLGTYVASGTVQATATAPAVIDAWYSIDFVASTSASTTVAVRLYEITGTTTARVSDTDLPGNDAGFTTTPIDISGLDPIAYPALVPVATLSTIDTDYTPRLNEWELRYIESQPVLSGIPVTVTGSKSLGSDASGGPVFKNVFTDVTDGSGELTLTDIEYDAYTITIDDSTRDAIEVCPSNSIALEPNTTESVDFTIASIAGPRLRVAVTDVAGNPISGALVQLEQSGSEYTQTTSNCGQTFFSGGLTTATSTVTVNRFGYSTGVANDVPVHATATVSIIIN
jgi:hypothetical protein